jgi:hypothetical protein
MSARPGAPRKPRFAKPGLPEPLGPASPARRRRTPASGSTGRETALLTEIVLFFLYDVGRHIDLKQVAALIPAHDDFDIVKRRDTPASLSLPRPLILALGESESVEPGDFESFSAQAKIFEEGALSLILRVKVRAPFSELASARSRSVLSGGRHTSLDSWAEENYRKVIAAIGPALEDPVDPVSCDREHYVAYCLLECPDDPAAFVAANREVAAALLIGEETALGLHPSQVLETLGRPFSYRRDELAVFDLDHCLIIDPRGDYEDLLHIVEHANYQLLELRVLDKLLDRWLDEAEDEVRRVNAGERKRKPRGTSAWKKLARIQALRFDALFILENLENSSKIIGDYYLGQIYNQLCDVFNTDGWKWSIERRLDILQNVYDMVRTDSNERLLITLEVWFIIVCIVIPVIQIFIMLRPVH